MDFIYKIADFLWTYVIAYVLLGMGLYYSVRLKFPQFRFFKHGLHIMKKSMKKKDDGVSGFGALCAAVGGQVGTGSLVGVASALAVGGPGAIFWMWVTALFGMVITFSESVLGQMFRVKAPDGSHRGGPPYYIAIGLKSKFFSIFISFLYVLGIGIFIASLQTNSIANAFAGVVDINPLYPGIAVIVLAGIVIIGGAKRLADVSSFVVPFMALTYILLVLYIVFSHISLLPAVIGSIFRGAFSTTSAVGGAIGYTFMKAFTAGCARGLFSNDAGNGVAGMMHASAEVKHPVQQGFLGMLGTFITTCIICSFTAFAILMTDVLSTGANGINLLQEAFHVGMGPAGRWVVFGAMFLFGFTTLLADIFYGETGLIYIFKSKAKIAIPVYRIILTVVLVLSCTVDLKAIWAAIDTFVGLIVFINLGAMLLLFKYVKFALNDYLNQRKAGIEEPEYDRETSP